ncbi:MAG: Na(+)-translocating NADH-quinone reductase subunit A [bacterium]
MSSFSINKGLNLRLFGAPTAELAEVAATGTVAVQPGVFADIKPRLDVKEGDTVRRGSVLFHDKQNPALKFRSPAAGNVESIVYGARRAIDRIVIRADTKDEAEPLRRFAAGKIPGLKREDVLAHLVDTGFLALIRQRPFGHIARTDAVPKSIFVNAMNTAPFRPDANLVVRGREPAFQAGLDVLTRLTSGKVHLCIPDRSDLSPALAKAGNVETHTFKGPHPAGTTSVHIYNIDPLKPHDIVWTANADDVCLIGQLFIEGALPATRIVTLAGPGVRDAARKHYRVRIGTPVAALTRDRLGPGELRVVAGDVLSGAKAGPDAVLGFYDTAVTVLAENRERHFLGWLAPGLNTFSVSRTCLSRWLRPGAEWPLDTNKHGGNRAMVLTGLYEKYVPMNIMVDYLLRAVIAHDTDEAVKLGILETLPEDYALCSLVCPSKTDVMGIVDRGLQEIEKEGI